MSGVRKRLDHLLVERGLVENRSRAQGLILAGSVRVDGKVVTKAGSHISPDESLTVDQNSPFVSRAGEKLSGALDAFEIDVEGRDCLDAGASTGGFTDALLKRGANRVISVDVGYGQLDWTLRKDPRVTVMERTNVRKLSGEELPYEPDFLVADLSFISLFVALERLLRTTPSIQEAVLLVKPQFEAGPELVGRGGLVRDTGIHETIIRKTAESFASLNFGAADVMRAPVTGRRAGNQEYPLHLSHNIPIILTERDIREAVSGG